MCYILEARKSKSQIMVNLESVKGVSMFVNGVLLHSHRVNSTENMLFSLEGHKFRYESHILLASFDLTYFPKFLAPNTFTRRIKTSVFEILEKFSSEEWK